MLVLPGSTIPLPSDPSSSSVTLGPGISSITTRSNEQVFAASRAGLLSTVKNSIYISGASKRYVPAPRDIVLGTIVARHAEGYRVDVGGAHMASLDGQAFEGATKRSKPNLKVGTLVYARVSLASRDMEPEIECVDPATGKAEGFGELKGGVMVECSLELCRKLLTPKHPLLPALAAHIPFETAIGLNGRVWFKAGSAGQTIALRRVIEAVDAGECGTERGEVEAKVKEFMA